VKLCDCVKLNAMSNITLSVDDNTYRTARIVAAERGTSVSAMVRDYLQSLRSASKRWSKPLNWRCLATVPAIG
jgi:plasmid stability protein